MGTACLEVWLGRKDSRGCALGEYCRNPEEKATSRASSSQSLLSLSSPPESQPGSGSGARSGSVKEVPTDPAALCDAAMVEAKEDPKLGGCGSGVNVVRRVSQASCRVSSGLRLLFRSPNPSTS